MLAALCLFPPAALAADWVSVSIPVEIEGGGTAIVIPEVNCPLPEASSVEVPDGETENIQIVFSEPGVYGYTIKAESTDASVYSPVYYTAAVTVKTDTDGALSATVVLKKPDSDYKPDRCLFEPIDAPPTPTSGGETQPPAPTEPKNPPSSRPRTGDDSMLDLYLLICIAASGGLFVLAVIYSASTDRLIGRK